MKPIVLNYYLVLVYRLVVVLLMFAICRFVFYGLNSSLFKGIGSTEWLQILKGGLKFDIGALFYCNALIMFLMLIPLPLKWRYNGTYQSVIKGLFFTINGLAILLNMIDCIYYRFTLRRSSLFILKEFSHEQNIGQLTGNFVYDYWYMIPIFALLVFTMVYLTNRVTFRKQAAGSGRLYYFSATLFLLLSAATAVAGIRGDFRHSTRPYTISNAGVYVNKPSNIYLVLNTPFVFIRTIDQDELQKVHYFSEEELEAIYTPVHKPKTEKPFDKKNVVLIILESFGKEGVGFYNKDLDKGTYTGYTPFLDSLAGESLIFWNSFANGRKSIDAIPSCIASIPADDKSFVLTPYVSDSIQSMAHILKAEGYHTSFFHGAPNGSMGFDAIAKLLGIEHYYGKNEFGNDDEYDGIWGIWDEPFFQYFGNTLSTFSEPFFGTVFSVSSHHPFRVPEQYKGQFKKGPLPIYECMGYTDMALKKFFQTVQKEPWFQNTIFVITADHATLTHHPEYNNAWGDVAIPILFYAPGDPAMKGLQKEGIVQQIDIMPTVLGYLNYNKPFLAFGENAIEANAKKQAFAFATGGGFRCFYQNYLLLSTGQSIMGTYHYQTDRLLQNDITAENKDTAAMMQQYIQAFVQQYNNRLIENRLIAR